MSKLKIDYKESLLNAQKYIAQLEKENAELKHQLNKNPCVCNTEWHCSDCLEKLAQAKKIIKELCDLIHYKHGYFHQEIIDAEQFLKENK